jgi:hypothetical protein
MAARSNAAETERIQERARVPGKLNIEKASLPFPLQYRAVYTLYELSAPEAAVKVFSLSVLDV